jgi:antitoxin MazE
MSTVRVQLVRWGNSNAVRLPKTVLDKANVREGEQFDVQVETGKITLLPTRKKMTLDSLVAGITRKNRHGEQQWGKAIGKETW